MTPRSSRVFDGTSGSNRGTPVTRTFEAFAEEFRAFATDVLADGAPWRAWVAEDEGRLVGGLWL
jgi:hypothetical protein